MYDALNRLAASVVKTASRKYRGGWDEERSPHPKRASTGPGWGFTTTLAAEVASLLPVRTRSDFEQLDAQLINVRSMMRLNPTVSLDVREALDKLNRECVIVRASLEDS